MGKIIRLDLVRKKRAAEESCQRTVENSSNMFRYEIKRMKSEGRECKYKGKSEKGLPCCREPELAKEACEHYTGIMAYTLFSGDIESLIRKYVDPPKSEELKLIMLEAILNDATKTAICSYDPTSCNKISRSENKQHYSE